MYSKTFVLFLIVALCSIQLNDAENDDEDDEDNKDPTTLWTPKGVSRDEFIRCFGMPCKQWERIQLKRIKLQTMISGNKSVTSEENKESDFGHPEKMSHIEIQNLPLDGDVVLNEKQIDEAIEKVKNTKSSNTKIRKKRKWDGNIGKLVWGLPIYWKFDGSHNKEQQNIIYEALREFSDNTCVTFNQVPTEKDLGKRIHMIFTSGGQGCYTNIGKPWPCCGKRIVNLEPDCFVNGKGVAIHEVAHAFGFWHEQSRGDRDDYVEIHNSNIPPYWIRQYWKHGTYNNAPYDVNSIMHYPSRVFSKFAISKKEDAELYRGNMGQRLGFSYLDLKSINILCKSMCRRKPISQPCQNKGYQNPKDCSKCVCPPGYGGNFCEIVAPIKHNCGGTILDLTSKDYDEISSPKYPHRYPRGIECYWYIKVPENYQITFKFVGSIFRIPSGYVCAHFVEVLFKGDFDLPGPRFCSGAHPDVTLKSERNEMLIMFNSMAQTMKPSYGFKAQVKAVKRTTTNHAPTTTKATTTISKTTTRTTTQATTTKVSSITTTKTIPKPTSHASTIEASTSNSGQANKQQFHCDFENGDHKPSSCGISQSQKDVFDWSSGTGETPSGNTGPKGAHSGQFYIFIEASNRKMNDNARIELPAVKSDGMYCLKFWYNMYGTQINRLNIFIGKDNNLKKIWEKVGAAGRDWKEAEVKDTMEKGSRIMFEGLTENWAFGDIALDDISLSTC